MPPGDVMHGARPDEERACILDSDDDLAAKEHSAGPSPRPDPDPGPGPSAGPGTWAGASAAAGAAGLGNAVADSAGRGTAERPCAAASQPAHAANGGCSAAAALEQGFEVARMLANSVSASVVRAVGGRDASGAREAKEAGAACAASTGLGSGPGAASPPAGGAGASAEGASAARVVHTGSGPGSGVAGPPDDGARASAGGGSVGRPAPTGSGLGLSMARPPADGACANPPGSGVVSIIFAGINSTSPTAEVLGYGAGQGFGAEGAGGRAAQGSLTEGRRLIWGPPSPGRGDAPGAARRVSLPNLFVSGGLRSPRAGGGGCIAPNPSICPGPGFGAGAAGGAGADPATLLYATQRLQQRLRQHDRRRGEAKVCRCTLLSMATAQTSRHISMLCSNVLTGTVAVLQRLLCLQCAVEGCYGGLHASVSGLRAPLNPKRAGS